ncbi:PucR family transcriptional regulator [Streptomyces ochraceiscleroticus]|uniref:PucR family transcriptional regulator n=1 Tax=Streptomyces ochraceiscleroticus TaxID=47761 RepID=A0ABW1MLF5_9ACTN|nr:PucR family transcriptional regulator [Streptomyces ochraceiscleroticus]
MSLPRVLAHPSLSPARPRVLAGQDGLERAVRWIHSSEVLDIASLLRGGELLLTGGSVLARATADEQRTYIRKLADRGVAGVAIETGAALPAVPPPLLEAATAARFPVIELRRVVPFVEVAEVINGVLVNDSVTRLRLVGALSQHLSGLLAEGGGPQEVLDALTRQVGAPATLLDPANRVIAVSGHTTPAHRPTAPTDGTSVRLTIRGVPTATLVVHPGPGADLEMIELARDRTAEALQLALLRSRPPGPRELAAGELVRLATGGTTHPDRLRRLAASLGFAAEAPVIGIAALTAGPASGFHGLEELLGRHGRFAVDMPSPLSLHALISVRTRPRTGQAANSRARLLSDLTTWCATGDNDTTVAVGPLLPDIADCSASLKAALESLHLHQPSLSPALPPRTVIDATDLSVERLLLADSFHAPADALVHEQLGPLLALRAPERDPLLTTLETYFETGCHKTRTAELLHLQRQSLYARLRRAFTLLGGDPTGTPRALAVHLALRLHRHTR